MKKFTFILMVILMPMWIWGQSGQYYYYYNGEKQYLELNTEYIFISAKADDISKKLRSISNTIPSEMKRDNATANLKNTFVKDQYWTEVKALQKMSSEEYKKRLEQLKIMDKDIIVAPYFYNSTSKKIGLSNYFYVKLNNLADTTVLKRKAIETKTEIVGTNQFMPLWHVLTVTPTTGRNAMEVANYMFETGLFQYAEPDLMEDALIECANDYYFNKQWGMEAINICNIWPPTNPWQAIYGQTEGKDVIVAIVDHGIDLEHPDLRENLYPVSYDTETNSSPSRLYGSHGTACAGIVGAVRNNNIGIAGVAPKCKLMSVSNSLRSTPLSQMKRADGISWAWRNGAEVISNSWRSGTRHAVIDEAVNQSVTLGRTGLGAVVLFAAGNYNQPNPVYPADLPDVIAVGAMSPCFERKSPTSCDGENWGSNYGGNLSVVAPGVKIPTTYPNDSYTETFNGTSSACPYVAGVAALVIYNHKDYSAKEIKNRIESSAQKVGNYNYNINKPNGTWNNEMGYGLIDAPKAARKILTPGIYGVVITPLSEEHVCVGEYITFRVTRPNSFPILEIATSENLELIQTGTSHYQYLATADGPAFIKIKTQSPIAIIEREEGEIQAARDSYWVTSDIVWVGVAAGNDISGFQSTIFNSGSTYNFTAIDSSNTATNFIWNITGNATIQGYGYDLQGRRSGVTVKMNSITTFSNFQLTLTSINKCGTATIIKTGRILPGISVKSGVPEGTDIIRVYNINGYMVYNASTSGYFDIKETNLQDGIYIIETIDAEGNKNREKVILKR